MAKIQIITTYDQSSYAACEALWLEMAEQAISQGHEVEALLSRHAASHPSVQRLARSGARMLFRRPAPQGGLASAVLHRAWQRSGARWTIPRMISAHPEIRILNVGTMAEIAREPWASLLEASHSAVAVIVHSNSEIRSYEKHFNERLASIMQKACRVYFVSDRLRENAEEQLICRIPGAVVVRNPVNLKTHEIEPWPIGGDALRIALVGRLDSFVKGHIRLLHALSAEHWKARKWELRVFGDGPDKERIQQAAQFYGIEDRVYLDGFVEDVRSDIWRSHHILAMPSLLEGMPLALVEAMICGRPAVCSDVGGAAELIKDGHNGFLAGSPFAKQIAEAFERAWESRSNLESMGRRAHADARRFKSAQPGCELLKDILDAVR